MNAAEIDVSLEMGARSKHEFFAELRKALAEAMTRADATASLPKLVRTQTRQVLETFSDQKAAELLARFSRNHTWQCPTLVVLRAFAFLDASDLSDDARLKYIPFSMRERWNPKGHLRAENGTPEDLANSKKVFQKELEIVRAMRLAGLKFLAGTDAPTPNVFPGFGLHDELRLLVSAGLTPMEALQAATRNAATYLGLLDSLGTVEKGKIADLVLLEGNPLDDISNTQKIAAVVLGGKLISKFSLQSMLAEVERMANKK
ncbi:MAG: amidohydrolase family protein [Acidobacteria bacterium]|nr:amidohydrolase family protein [Acidobacteriota bacterium]